MSSSPSDLFPVSETAFEINEDSSEIKETIIVEETINSGEKIEEIEVFEKIVKSGENKMTNLREFEKETNEMLVIGLGVGIAALLLLLMLIGACFYIKKVRLSDRVTAYYSKRTCNRVNDARASANCHFWR